MLIPSILYFTDVNLVHYTFFSEELLSNGGMYVEFWCIAYSVSKFFFFFFLNLSNISGMFLFSLLL